MTDQPNFPTVRSIIAELRDRGTVPMRVLAARLEDALDHDHEHAPTTIAPRGSKVTPAEPGKIKISTGLTLLLWHGQVPRPISDHENLIGRSDTFWMNLEDIQAAVSAAGVAMEPWELDPPNFEAAAPEAAYPACSEHQEVQHRDGKPPWCNHCGWNRGRGAVPARRVGNPR